jgi:hypothetical protein
MTSNDENHRPWVPAFAGTNGEYFSVNPHRLVHLAAMITARSASVPVSARR